MVKRRGLLVAMLALGVGSASAQDSRDAAAVIRAAVAAMGTIPCPPSESQATAPRKAPKRPTSSGSRGKRPRIPPER